jgi:metal-sulfur cluster biosynthetic enzyme
VTATTDTGPTATAWGVLTAHDSQARIHASSAASALRKVRGLPALEALTKLKRGPGSTCEPVARVLDTALARAEAAGIQAKHLVVVDGSAEPGPDLLRENRKLGKGDWFTIPTASVSVQLRPTGLHESTPHLPAVHDKPESSPTPRLSGHSETGERVGEVREALYEVLDPDLGVNIIDLGFVRAITVDSHSVATLTMTLTSAACPLTGIIEEQIRRVLVDSDDCPVTDFRIDWVWQPAWQPSDITEDGRDQLRAIGFTRF